MGEPTWETVRAKTQKDHDQTSRWMFGLEPPRDVEPDMREHLLQRHAAFWTWLERDLDRAELLPARSPHGTLGYRVDVGPRLGLDVPVWIIGLDTAWLAGDDNDAGKLMLTADQIRQLGTEGGAPLPGLRLALGHHPLGELADHIQARRLLADRVDLYLHGHQHVPLTTVHVDPDRSVVELAAGCLFEGHRLDRHKNGHAVVTLHLDDAGRPQRSDLRLRSWSKDGLHWFDDPSIYEQAIGGRLSLTWPGAPPIATAPPAGPPARAPTPAQKAWQEKLTFLLEQEPVTVDPDAKHRLRKLIEEARAKIQEYGGP